MKTLARILLVILIVGIAGAVLVPFITKYSHKPESEPTYTNVVIVNNSEQDSVKVYVTLQAPNRVMGLFGITDTVQGNTSKGYFYAHKGVEYSSNTPTTLFGVVVSFVGDNDPCQVAIPKGFKWGVNIFEFSINTPFETFDISCVDGVNCIIKATVSDTLWTTGDSIYIARFNSTQNNFPVADNMNIRGVFPYRCSDCIGLGTAIPKNCLNLPDTCNTIRTCQVARTNHNGGTITVQYLGDIEYFSKRWNDYKKSIGIK